MHDIHIRVQRLHGPKHGGKTDCHVSSPVSLDMRLVAAGPTNDWDRAQTGLHWLSFVAGNLSR